MGPHIFQFHGKLGMCKDQYMSNRSHRRQPPVLSSNHLMFARAHTFTSCSLPWYLQKSHVDNVFLSFFNHTLPRFQVRPVLPDCRVEADWLKCAVPPNKVTLLASQHPFCHTIPCTPTSRTAYQQQRLLCRGPKAGVCRVSRTDVDFLMQTITKKIFMWILNKTITSQGSLFPESNLERVASLLLEAEHQFLTNPM